MTANILAWIWPYVLAAVLAGFSALKWRASIIAKERAKQAERERKARGIADEVENDIGAMPPAEARKELSKWSKS